MYTIRRAVGLRLRALTRSDQAVYLAILCGIVLGAFGSKFSEPVEGRTADARGGIPTRKKTVSWFDATDGNWEVFNLHFQRKSDPKAPTDVYQIMGSQRAQRKQKGEGDGEVREAAKPGRSKCRGSKSTVSSMRSQRHVIFGFPRKEKTRRERWCGYHSYYDFCPDLAYRVYFLDRAKRSCRHRISSGRQTRSTRQRRDALFQATNSQRRRHKNNTQYSLKRTQH